MHAQPVARGEIIDPEIAHRRRRVMCKIDALDSPIWCRGPHSAGLEGDFRRETATQSPEQNIFSDPMCKIARTNP